MSRVGSLCIESGSIFYRMNPIVKTLMFILWSITIFMNLDIRTSLFLVVFGSTLLCLSKIPYGLIKNLFFAVVTFNFVNAILILIISPELGIALAGHKTVLVNLFGHQIFTETVMYLVILSLKYLSLLPVAMIFIFTTCPSQFACSLNRIGVPYKIAYTFSLILRYLPEVHMEFKTIVKARNARGITFGKGEQSFWRRTKNLFSITVPLMNATLERIDNIVIAMELRSFGKKRVRTWYNGARFTRADAISLFVMITMFVLFVYLKCKLWFRFNYNLF